jgi:hypothetical protein
MIEDLWYKNTVIYSLDLESFMDANGDGVGDFEGLIAGSIIFNGSALAQSGSLLFIPARTATMAMTSPTFMAWIFAMDRVATSLNSSIRRTNSASRCSSIWSSTTPPMSTPGFRPLAATKTPVSRLVCMVRETSSGLEKRDGLPGSAACDLDT